LKERTLEALLGMVKAKAAREPILMLVEDAQWMDPSTLEFLGLLFERLRSDRVLLVVSHRPEFESPRAGQANITALTLNHSCRRESAAMVAAVTGGKALPEEGWAGSSRTPTASPCLSRE
jgi:predicted ATPase